MPQRDTGDVPSASPVSDLAIPTMGGVLGGFVGWAGWQTANAVCLLTLSAASPVCVEQWRGNVADFAAIAPALAGYGLGSNLGVWLQSIMLRKAEQRVEKLTEQLEQERVARAEERQQLKRLSDAVDNQSKAIERLSKNLRSRRRRR